MKPIKLVQAAILVAALLAFGTGLSGVAAAESAPEPLLRNGTLGRVECEANAFILHAPGGEMTILVTRFTAIFVGTGRVEFCELRGHAGARAVVRGQTIGQQHIAGQVHILLPVLGADSEGSVGRADSPALDPPTPPGNGDGPPPPGGDEDEEEDEEDEEEPETWWVRGALLASR